MIEKVLEFLHFEDEFNILTFYNGCPLKEGFPRQWPHQAWYAKALWITVCLVAKPLQNEHTLP